MYNAETPLRAELPSSRQLLRSTALATISAIVILVAIVLPAEYGIDPTGVGRVLRMTEMGEIKQQLAAEAAADATAASAGNPAAPVAAVMANASAATSDALIAAPKAALTAQPQANWRDEVTFTLASGEGKEIKLRMNEGEKAEFEWVVNGGSVNFDTHGDGGGRSISYEKGRGVPADDGNLVAAFTGNHGWYWRNRGQATVKVVLRTRGQYSDLKQVQ
ncbi:transmembrane anchor protein [Hydrogenophaga sp. BPS33]|uniref:transmembrane anchor protein n=1 Tax=Hydrogenophaga sp. BPS33 TaxID=2651974 RepID=UPI00131FBF9B|nr:transmembrane anchor protein [Hydrogenophaga sp. BPS33]QHE89136.1 transmembrane anchor protein [Hydrogenophaga sp. BPS33]